MSSNESSEFTTELIESDEQLNFTLESLTLSQVHDDLSDLSTSFDNLSISGNKSFNLNSIVAAQAPQNVPYTEQLIAAARNYGEILPKFDGKINTLYAFIIKVQQYYNRYGESLNQFIERVKAAEMQLNTKLRADPTITNEQCRVHQEINEQRAMEVLYDNCPSTLQTILDVKTPERLNETITIILNYVTKHQEKIEKNFKKGSSYTPHFNRNATRNDNHYNPRNNNASGQQRSMENAQGNKVTPMSTSNFRSNRFSGENFRSWRQNKPMVNFTAVETQNELDPTNESFMEATEGVYQCAIDSSLPCLQLPTLGINILIDTGATNSLINPATAQRLFPNSIYKEPFILKTITTETFHSHCADVNLFEEKQFLKYYIVNFHPHIDILLGSDSLNQMNAKIDYAQGTIELNGYLHQLKKYSPVKKENSEEWNAVTFPTNIKKGTVLMPRQQVADAIIPETLTT
ncbi:hypothetical protein ILUMI_18447, partial [Ignelater luminosus]